MFTFRWMLEKLSSPFSMTFSEETVSIAQISCTKKKKGIEQCWIRCAASLNVLTQQEMKTHLNISMLEHYEIFFCICTTLIFSKLASKVINTSTYNSPQAIRIDFLHVIMSSKYIYLFCALDSCNSTSNAVSPLAISLITDKGKLFGAVNKKILSS